MRTLMFIVTLALAGTTFADPQPAIAPHTFASGALAMSLETDIAAMERSAPSRWRDFSQLAGKLDGEKAETFAIACAYLVRRDPTIFLRRHLAGDSRALICGREGYGWSGKDYQGVLDSVYRFRLLDATSAAERRQIEEFIARTTKKT